MSGIGWTTPDPLADKYYSVSPYAFCGNNPLNFVDPDGLTPRLYIQKSGLGHAFITTSLGGINTSSTIIKTDVVTPRALARYMNKQSEENSSIIKIDNPESFIQNILKVLKDEDERYD